MQQLLDKWERLRTSEYLRPDEKLMLNHCISDLKRFMDHSGEATEMVGNRTAVEWLIGQIKKDIIGLEYDYADELKQAKEMEKEQIKDAYYNGTTDEIRTKEELLFEAEHFYNETYGGNK